VIHRRRLSAEAGDGVGHAALELVVVVRVQQVVFAVVLVLHHRFELSEAVGKGVTRFHAIPRKFTSTRSESIAKSAKWSEPSVQTGLRPISAKAWTMSSSELAGWMPIKISARRMPVNMV